MRVLVLVATLIATPAAAVEFAPVTPPSPDCTATLPDPVCWVGRYLWIHTREGESSSSVLVYEGDGKDVRNPVRVVGDARFKILRYRPDIQLGFFEVEFDDGKVRYINARHLAIYVGDSLHSHILREDPALLKARQDAELGANQAAAKAEADRSKVAEKRQIAAAKKQAAKPGVQIGMTKSEVLESSWGRPHYINSTHSAAGTTEQWVYGGRNYLYFRNGLLETIQN